MCYIMALTLQLSLKTEEIHEKKITTPGHQSEIPKKSSTPDQANKNFVPILSPPSCSFLCYRSNALSLCSPTHPYYVLSVRRIFTPLTAMYVCD